MTSSCSTSTTGGQTECTSEIPGYDVITADEKEFPLPADDVTESTKPETAGESPNDVTPTAGTAQKERRGSTKNVEGHAAFSRSPEQMWNDPPGFRGNDNYGFEWAKWARQTEMERLSKDKEEST